MDGHVQDTIPMADLFEALYHIPRGQSTQFNAGRALDRQVRHPKRQLRAENSHCISTGEKGTR